MEKIVCRRCGKVMEKRGYMLQTITYLGEWYPRIDICDDCHTSYVNWLGNGPTERSAINFHEDHPVD